MYHAQHAIKQEIPDVLGIPAPPLPSFGQPGATGPEKQEGQQVHDAVPMHVQRTNGEGHRVNCDEWIAGLGHEMLSSFSGV